VSVGRRWYRYILILVAMDTYVVLPIGVLMGILFVASPRP
jgi:hypothetical protein